MSELVPLLIHYANKRCEPASPVVSAPALIQWLAQNGLMLRDDTLADGNCGIHAFVCLCATLLGGILVSKLALHGSDFHG